LTQATADIRLVSDTASAYLTHWASSVHPALHKKSKGVKIGGFGPLSFVGRKQKCLENLK